MKPRTTPPFPKWLVQTTPNWTWDWPHQLYLYKKLHQITLGNCRRLMIFMPPRHSKSETVTVRYSAWRLEKDPKLNIILGSYNQKLANRFSRKIRRIVEERVLLSKDRKAMDEWETEYGGGVRAVGVGAGVTGFGAGLIMIDDPVKNRAEAESATYRDRAWDWFNDDIYTRLEPEASITLIQTRWHEDDLAGRLLKETEEGGEYWNVVNLPALAEGRTARTLACMDTNVSESNVADEPAPQDEAVQAGSLRSDGDPLNRAEGEALCPERYDREALLRIKNKLGSYLFAALYQQRPHPLEGGLFKRKWFANIISKVPEGLRWARGYDLAVSTKTSADYTASFRCAWDNEGNLYIADGFRKRVEYPEQRRYVIERMLEEKNTAHGIEKALHGQAFVQDLNREVKLQGKPLKAIRVDADKFTRALAWANTAEEGKVFLVKGAWNDDFLDEVCRFMGKGDKHDDQVDAVSLAVQMLAKSGKGSHGW